MKVIVQNLATEYRDEGNGPVVLFLHGWQSNLHTFDSLVSLLPVTMRIIRLDLPGFGESELPKEVWDLDHYVQFIEDFIRKLNIRVNVLVGHSFGGRIIIKGESEKKSQGDKIILIASAGIATRRTFRNSMLKMAAKIGGFATRIPPLSFLRKKLRKKLYEKIGSDYQKAGAMQETFLKIITEDLGYAAQNIEVPTLLIWGAGDNETPLADGERLSKLIRHSELKVVEGAGHFVHEQKPREVARLIQEFLSL